MSSLFFFLAFPFQIIYSQGLFTHSLHSPARQVGSVTVLMALVQAETQATGEFASDLFHKLMAAMLNSQDDRVRV